MISINVWSQQPEDFRPGYGPALLSVWPRYVKRTKHKWKGREWMSSITETLSCYYKLKFQIFMLLLLSNKILNAIHAVFLDPDALNLSSVPSSRCWAKDHPHQTCLCVHEAHSFPLNTTAMRSRLLENELSKTLVWYIICREQHYGVQFKLLNHMLLHWSFMNLSKHFPKCCNLWLEKLEAD